MGIKTENFEFSSDFLEMSEGDFKAHMKKTRGVGAREAKSIFNELHGLTEKLSKKDGELVSVSGKTSET